MSMDTPVIDFYGGRSVFITGGSGFMGKVLVEKLLYSVPNLGTVYILVRPKRGLSPEQRLEQMQRLPLFERLRKERPAALKKIYIVAGDVLTDGLGVSESMVQKLASEVSLVFHCAATLRLEAPLGDNMRMNVVGTLRTLDLARRLPNLVAFVHLSTAFCYPDFEVLRETLHPPSVAPRDLLHLLSFLSDEQLKILTPSLLGSHPNCYTFTKRLAEQLVAEAYPELPAIILRPSIVCPSFRDPMAGWVDSLNGPMGVMLGAGKGVIRTMLCNKDHVAQVIPVDVAINGVICAAHREATKKVRSKEIPIYNLNCGDQQPTTWGKVLELGKQYSREMPLAMPLWYPNGTLTTNPVLHEYRRIFYHIIPAYFVDLLFFIFGQERILVRIQKRISQGLEVLQYFTMRPWIFECQNFENMASGLSEKEKDTFLMVDENFDIKQYLENCVEGGRVYCFKEDPEKIYLNRIHHNVLYVLDWIMKIMFWLLIFSFLASWFRPIRVLLSFGGPFVKHLPLLGKAVFNEQY